MNYEITLSFRTQGEQAIKKEKIGWRIAETVHIELLNHDSDYFRPYEYAVAAIVRESSSFSLVYERLFGKK